MAAISDFGAQENSLTVAIVSPSICHEVIGPDVVLEFNRLYTSIFIFQDLY